MNWKIINNTIFWLGLIIILFEANKINSQNIIRGNFGLINDSQLLESDILHLSKICFEDSLKRYQIITQIINTAILKEHAKILNLLPTDKEFEELNNHINSTTQAPEILEKIKVQFGESKYDYYKTYLEPILLDTKLRLYQSRDSIIQKEPRNKIEKAYSLLVQKNSFTKTANIVNGVVGFDTVIIKSNLNTNSNSVLIMNESQLAKIIDSLNNGQLYNQIIENEHQYQIVALVNKTSTQALFAILTINKVNFEDWLEKNSSNFKFLLYDQTIIDLIKKNYPNLWWSKKLTYNP